MKIHFAGSDGQPNRNEMLLAAGAHNRLESFYTLGSRPPSQGFNLLLDSGGFVARTKNVQINVEDYANYINLHGVQLAFELDTNDVLETEANRKYLMEHTKATIIPVYHFSDYRNPATRDMIADFARDFEYISIGGVAGTGIGNKAKAVYDYVFAHTLDKVKVHGLGITNEKMLTAYPWYSVDSTSWLAFARFGSAKSVQGKMLTMLLKSKHYSVTERKEIVYWVAREKYYTALWEARGVKW